MNKTKSDWHRTLTKSGTTPRDLNEQVKLENNLGDKSFSVLESQITSLEHILQGFSLLKGEALIPRADRALQDLATSISTTYPQSPELISDPNLLFTLPCCPLHSSLVHQVNYYSPLKTQA